MDIVTAIFGCLLSKWHLVTRLLGIGLVGARERGLTASPLNLPDPSMRFLAEFRGLHVSAFSIRPLMRIRRPFR